MNSAHFHLFLKRSFDYLRPQCSNFYSTFTQTLWFFISLPHRLKTFSLKLLQTHQKYFFLLIPWLLFRVSIRLSTIDFFKHKTSNAFFLFLLLISSISRTTKRLISLIDSRRLNECGVENQKTSKRKSFQRESSKENQHPWEESLKRMISKLLCM